MPNIQQAANINWRSGKDMKAAAHHVQTKMIEDMCYPLGSNGKLKRFQLVQMGLVPSQREILERLASGGLLEYLHRG